MSFGMVNRNVPIARGVLNPAAGSGEQSPPGSGATIVIYDSTATSNGLQGNVAVPFARLVLTINSSANDAAPGIFWEGSDDNGLHWDTMNPSDTYTTASGLMVFDRPVTMPQVRIRYTNSANVLTTWRMSLIGIIGDRTKTT